MTMRPAARLACLVVCFLTLPGCAAIQLSSTYTPPAPSLQETPPLEVDKSLDSVWIQLIRGLATSPFDIVTMDRQTGFVSATCMGDPEEYVDGGTLSYVVMLGTSVLRSYMYPATKADTAWTETYLGSTCRAERQVYLDGKVNIVLQDAGPHRTRVTVNVRYTLTINEHSQQPGGEPSTSQEVISFTTGQPGQSRSGTIFRSTRRWEDAIAALVR